MWTNLIPPLEESLFQPNENLADIILDIAEIGLDSDLTEGIIKEFPILKTMAGLCKVGFEIRNKILLVRLANFLEAYNSNTIDPFLLEKHRIELSENHKKAERELSRIIILLDKAIEKCQAKNLGGFYRNYINGYINYDQFVELSEANDRLFLIDISLLEKIYCSPIKENEELSPQIEYQIERLKALGLIIEDYSILDAGSFDNWSSPRDYIVVSAFGERFITMKE